MVVLDANGKALKVGDAVWLPAKITHVLAQGKKTMLFVQHANADDMEHVQAVRPGQVVRQK